MFFSLRSLANFCARAAVCALALGAAQAQAAPPGQAPEGGAQAAQAVLRTAAGILGYTRWPQPREELRLCVVGATAYADALLQASGQRLGQRQLLVQRVQADDIATLQTCASLYLGQMPADDWRAMLQQLAGQALLTISEHEDLCRLGAMFCLRGPGKPGGSVGFEVNLDSVTRSGLRINPRVLQLARGKPAAAP